MESVSISLDQVTVRRRGRVVVDRFSGSFEPGTVTALIGGDGAGKSTLLKVLAGRIAYDHADGPGASTSPLAVDRRHIGYQSADAGVWRNLSVDENIQFVARAHSISTQRCRDRAEALLTLAGLGEASSRLAGQLSGGMRQKLGVVLASFHQPGLLLLDEPTTGVDPLSRADLWTLIADAAAGGATVVLTTTYLDEAERATRLYLLDDGRLLATGSRDEVIDHAPGRIWQAPATKSTARAVLASPNAWRRGDTIHWWQASSDHAAPAGFRPSDPDLEDACIALHLAAEATDTTPMPPRDGVAPRIHARATLVDTPTPVSHEATPLANAVGIVRRYGPLTALAGVSLAVAPGEIVGLLGGNGAGKTTLIRILLGLETTTDGRAELFGQQPSRSSRRRLGYVSQGLGLYPSLSALANLEFAAQVHGSVVTDYARAIAAEAGSVPIAQVSLGVRRMVAYLAAVGHDPDLLVLDEPTSGMGSLARTRLWRELREHSDQGAGVLVTTHHMQEAAQCDRLVILSAGHVVAAGTAEQITGSHDCLVVSSDQWQQVFGLLREAGLPALLAGRTVRVPGADRHAVVSALASAVPDATIETARPTLEEAMVLAARRSATGS